MRITMDNWPLKVRRQVEMHLSGCTACREELEELRAMSRWFAGASVPALSADAMRRVHRRVDVEKETTIVRLAEFFTGAAAAILLVGLIGLVVARESPGAATDWQVSMVSPQVDSPPPSAEVHLAHWMASDLSGTSGNDYE